jgi:cell division transport system permease protein
MNRPANTKGARRERDRRIRVNAWASNHRDCALDTIRRMLAQPVATAMTLAVIGIALLLPALLYVAGSNLGQFTDRLEATNRLTVYLAPDIDEQSVSEIREKLDSSELVESLQFISSEQAAEDFSRWSGLGDVLDSLADNPLPAAFVVQPTSADPGTLSSLQELLNDLTGVDLIQVDQRWLERLAGISRLIDRTVMTLVIILAFAVLFITGNSIRTLIANRQAEIRVMDLMGATGSYMARPFLYMGLWYGLFGGLMAWLLLQCMLLLLRDPASTLLASYGPQYRFIGLGGTGAVVLLLGSTGLGWLGAKLSVSRHLRALTRS